MPKTSIVSVPCASVEKQTLHFVQDDNVLVSHKI